MAYVKSLLAGAAAFVVTVIALSGIVVFLMDRYPQLALRFFAPQKILAAWHGFYSVALPGWQVVAAGALAFVIAFAWKFRRVTARTAG